jgi:hypothetical protein
MRIIAASYADRHKYPSGVNEESPGLIDIKGTVILLSKIIRCPPPSTPPNVKNLIL